MQLLSITLLAIIAGLYLCLKMIRDYWPKRHMPSVANSAFYLARSQHLAFYLQDIYHRFLASGESLVGIFLMFMPSVLLIDLELIKSVFIGEFESFPDRGFYHNVRDDPLSANIFRLEGEAWRMLRAKLSPTFTSGKMRYMYPSLVGIGDNFVAVLNELIGAGDGGSGALKTASAELEIRDLCARYTTDVIGSVAFGIECNSLRRPDTEFRVKGDKAFGCFNPIIERLGTQFPSLFRLLRVKAFPRELIDFYTKIVTENIAYRESNHIRRNDFMDILIQLKNTQNVGADGERLSLTLKEIIGQAFVFFIGGFDTTASTMTFCLYELSQNQAIQDKARADVKASLVKHNGQLSYECLKEMHYLKQVVLETLRKYPVAPTLRRVSRKNYAVPNTSYTFETGQHIIIPVYAIHHNPTYYPKPSQFDPDRFTPEAIKSRHPMTYLPFGAGPRMCIAERFGKMQTLTGLAVLLANFRFTATARTPKVLDFEKWNVRIFSVKGGVHLQVEAI